MTRATGRTLRPVGRPRKLTRRKDVTRYVQGYVDADVFRQIEKIMAAERGTISSMIQRGFKALLKQYEGGK